jgi:hypothetical protein
MHVCCDICCDVFILFQQEDVASFYFNRRNCWLTEVLTDLYLNKNASSV